MFQLISGIDLLITTSEKPILGWSRYCPVLVGNLSRVIRERVEPELNGSVS